MRKPNKGARKTNGPQASRGPAPRFNKSRAPIASAPDQKADGDFYPRSWRAIIGDHAINEALLVHPKSVAALWLIQGWESRQDLKTLHTEYRNKISQIEIKQEALLSRLGSSHQGAALFMKDAPQMDWDQILAKDECNIVLLDGIEDVHNLGAIIRTSWLMKVDAILIPQDRATRLTPVVHKVACGGVEHVPVEICGQFAQPLERLKKAGFWVYGLSHKAKSSIFQIKIPKKAVWCIGAEDKGLRITTERLCDDLVSIPQAAANASYNASVATGMVLMEAHRQQG
jgi:23S rRNA (guanosine2251-2'-O)-methyltransferase